MKRISLRIPDELWEKMQHHVVEQKIQRDSYSVNQFAIDLFNDFFKIGGRNMFASLSELYTAMTIRDPRTINKHGNGFRDDLPTFGGPDPADTREVWSWDERDLIVGTCADDLRIVPREERELD